MVITALLLALASLPCRTAFAFASQDTGPITATNADLLSGTNANPIDATLRAAIRALPADSVYPNNDYACLLNLAAVTLQADGTVIAQCRKAFKLFNERARPLAEIRLQYNATYQTMRVFNVRTIKRDGAVVNVPQSDLHESAQAGDSPVYQDARAVSFTMPGIEPDCIIDYSWKEVIRPLMDPGQFHTEWAFAGLEPTVVSQFMFRMPADKTMHFKVYNDDNISTTTVTSGDGKTKTVVWDRANSAPLPTEPSMPNRKEVQAWLEVSSLDSWQDVAHWFTTLQQSQTHSTEAMKATVADLITGKTGEEAKALAIYNWVLSHVRYVGLEFGLAAYQPHAASEVYDKLYGDCKDKATLLITLLAEAGIQAFPVLLHPEERRLVSPGLANPDAFNHCIVLANIDEKEVWLDATAETCPFGDIPEADRGVQAFVIRNGTGSFQVIPEYKPEENSADRTLRIALASTGNAEVQSNTIWRGAMAFTRRAKVHSLSTEQRADFMKGIASAFSTGANLKGFSFPNDSEFGAPMTMKMTSSAPNWARSLGNLLLVPAHASYNGFRETNPFVNEKRNWPIVHQDTSLIRCVTMVNLPAGYAIEEIPLDVHLTGSLSEFRRAIVRSSDGSSITITETFSERAGIIPADHYTQEKEIMEAVVKASDDLIVLRKHP